MNVPGERKESCNTPPSPKVTESSDIIDRIGISMTLAEIRREAWRNK